MFDFISDNMQLHHGDCLDRLRLIPDSSIDLVVTDPPYGTTACKWDVVIPFEPMWRELKRVTKPTAAIILFANQPFTSSLVMSNVKMFRYCWYWKKTQHSNPFLAKVQPLRVVEDIAVFYRFMPTYNPKTEATLVYKNQHHKKHRSELFHGTEEAYTQTQTGYPRNVLEYTSDRGLHPTQKPVALLSFLINTYSTKGETVLDFTMGSGSTGVACRNTDRRFIGIERDDKYYNVAKQRLGV